jgi:hypothetical protein
LGIQEALYASQYAGNQTATIVLPPTKRADYPNSDTILRAPVYVPSVVGNPTDYRGGLTIKGAGRRSTQLFIPPDFPLSVSGVFIAADHSSGTYGPTFEDFQINFVHADCVSSRASCTQFPPAFNISGTYGTEIRNVGIYAAWNGIKAVSTWNGAAWTPNVGGRFTFDHLEMSCLGDYYFSLDGVLDKVDIIEPYFWPQQTLATQEFFYNNTTVGLKVGRVDGLHIIGGMMINKNALHFFSNPQGQGCSFARVTGTGFDSYAHIEVECGRVQLANTYHTLASDGVAPSIRVLAGSVWISNSWFLNNTNNQPSIYVFSRTTAESGDALQVTGSRFDRSTNTPATQSPDIQGQLDSGTGYKITIEGNMFVREPNQTWGNPVIKCNSGVRCVVVGNTINDKGTGSGIFINMSVDDFHTVKSNRAPGWGMSFPATTNIGKYEDEVYVFKPLFSNVPTSCASQVSGTVWSDSGTLKLCP